MTTPGTTTPSPQSQNPAYTDNEILSRQFAARNQYRPTLPPEPLTEFQKFVASTTGQVLPIYGANLFRQVPSTFAPLDLTPVPPDYVIGPGDELRIRVWGQVNFRADVRVDRSGEIYLPQVGQVHVAGMPFSALDEHLRSAIGRVYRNFDLTADVGQIRAIQVYLAGEARRPGVYTVSSLSTLVDALFAAGGPSAAGSLRHIEVRRSGQVVADFDLYALLIHGDKSRDATLQSGDVIFIPAAGPQVAVTGSVRNPALYELLPGESLAGLIADAGGASATAAEARVSIERIDSHRDRYAMEVAYDTPGLATPLADGDLIRVYSIIPGYQKTVTLRGNTANPGRFAWHSGMRLSDLIPDKDSLITRNYWWKRTLLGLPAPEFEPLQPFPGLRQPASPIDLPSRQLTGPAANGSPANGNGPAQPCGANGSQTYQTYQSYYDQECNDQYYNNQYYNNQYYDSNQTAPDQSYFNQYGGDQNYNGANLPPVPDQMNYPGQSSSSSQDNLTPAQRAARANATAQRAMLAARNNAPMRTEVGPIAPEIDWDYAVIQRQDPQTLKTSLIDFNLGQLVLDHNASDDLALQPGDVVTVFSQADIGVPIRQQTKYVRLDGEFLRSGVYTVKPGETLRDLVKRAGGFSPNAYLYGSEFTRESTRVVQQRRLDEYVQSLELEMQRGNLQLASSQAASGLAATGSAAAQTSVQELLSRLRRIRATGRIVLEFKPGSIGVDSLPDITLEDGDHFVVPPRPSSVNVVGSVYDQNSFLFQEARRAGSYLHLAGGANRDADTRHTFIIRADGSVVSREAESGIWGNQFESLRMNPGDTIVVPEKTLKPSNLRSFIDWSQMFSQFALGAAYLTVLP